MQNILLIDDSWLLRSCLRRLLEAHGWAVSGAEDGAKGVQMAEEHHPDLVLMDLSMPGMDGLEASRRLKTEMPDVPILMFTSHLTSQLQAETEKAGIDAVVNKSEEVAPVINIIEQLLARSPAEGSA